MSEKTFEQTYLEERLNDLETAADNLTFMIENEDSTYYQSDFMKDNLTKVLTDIVAVRRRMAELKHE